MTQENKIFLLIGSVLAIATTAFIFIPKYFNSSNEDSAIKFLDFNTSLPSGYLPRKKSTVAFEKTKKPQQINKVLNENEFVKEEEKEIDYFNLSQQDAEAETQRKKDEILSKLMTMSFTNKVEIVTKKNKGLETDTNKTKEAAKEKDPYLRANDYGDDKNIASPYVDLTRTIELNSMISAILLPTVNSTLQGPVIAMIENNIYASHGRNILIPKGSKAYGRYIPLKKIGDERLAITWTKIRTPQGVNINLQASSADVMGRSGAIGEVDNHWFMRFGLAISLTTASNVIGYLATDGTKTTTVGEVSVTDARNDIIRDYKNDISSITNQIIKEQKVEPTLEIKAGTRIFIIPIDDIWFSQAENNKIDVRLVNKIQSNNKGEN